MKRDFVILFIELFCVQASFFLEALLQEYVLFCQIMLLFFLVLTYRRIYLLARRSLKNAQEEEKFQALQKQEQLQKEQEQERAIENRSLRTAIYTAYQLIIRVNLTQDTYEALSELPENQRI